VGSAGVVVDARERDARPWLPAVALPGAVYQGPDGEQVIAQEDGTVEPWPVRWLRSIASSPAPKGTK